MFGCICAANAARSKCETAALALQQTLLDCRTPHFDTVLPGYTHLQHAQPIVLAHHLLAYFWMLDRDDGNA